MRGGKGSFPVYPPFIFSEIHCMKVFLKIILNVINCIKACQREQLNKFSQHSNMKNAV